MFIITALVIYHPSAEAADTSIIDGLSSLSLQDIPLDQPFNPSIHDYTATVNSERSQTRLTAVAQNSSLNLRLNNVPLTSGQASDVLTLEKQPFNSDGKTVFIVETVGEKGTVSTYSITVTRQPVPTVQSVTTTGTDTEVTISWTLPTGRSDIKEIVVSYELEGAQVFKVLPLSTSKFTLNGLTPGKTYRFNIAILNNQIESNKSVNCSYNSSLQKMTAIASNDSSLNTFLDSSFNLDAGSLTYTYASKAPSSIKFTPTLQTGTAKVLINGEPIADGHTSSPIDLPPGKTTTVVFQVAMIDGTFGNSYKLNITVPFSPSAQEPSPENPGHTVNSPTEDFIVLDARLPSGSTEITPSFEDYKKELSARASPVHRFVVKIGEPWDASTSITMSNPFLNYLKAMESSFVVQSPSVTMTINSADLPTNTTTFSILRRKLPNAGKQAGAQAITTSFKIGIGGWVNNRIPVLVDLMLEPDINTASRVGILANNRYAESSYSDRLLRFTIIGDTDVSAITKQEPLIDINGHWASEEITWMADRFLVNGYSDHTFRPDKAITRAEFVDMIIKGLGIENSPEETEFTDVPKETWYEHSVAVAVKGGLVKGDRNHRFRPDDYITGEEMVSIIGRILVNDYYGNDVPVNSEAKTVLSFEDASGVSKWAVPAYTNVLSAGILSGTNQNKLFPKANGSRAQAVMMIYRYLNRQLNS